ncbi:MAG: 30S ribosomal protein S9 [Gemmataceae bacterium]|nr:30S ribosomal protein S9 [Gemmataceae bacterium]
MDTTTPAPPTSQQRKERPPVFLGKKRAYLGTGRRKTAVARVFLVEGSGTVTVNDKPLDVFFTEVKDHNAVLGPMRACDLADRLDVVAKVKGGGITGQAGAVSQGVARAIKSMFGLDKIKPQPKAAEPAVPPAEGAAPAPAPVEDPLNAMAKKLRDSGYLTRDSRMKERKKYGRKGARKAFQFSKR